MHFMFLQKPCFFAIAGRGIFLGVKPNLFTDPYFFLSQTSYNLHVGPNSKEPNIPSVHGLCTAFVQPECSIFFLSR